MGKYISLAESNRLKVRKAVEKEFRRYKRITCRYGKKRIFEIAYKNVFYQLPPETKLLYNALILYPKNLHGTPLLR